LAGGVKGLHDDSRHDFLAEWALGGYAYQRMIRSFRHRGLRALFEDGTRRGVRADQADRIERILARLDAAAQASDMALPGYRLHQLKGDLAGFWSVTVSGNWRVIFRFEHGEATDVDLVDYH
jgi:toxin HigB-1